MNEIESQSVALEKIKPQEMMRQSTDIASVCKEIVVKTALQIQGRKYVRVEGWQSIATAHGCIASSKDVERIEGGWRAIGEIRRISDGIVIATAEGFVGTDETKTWAQRPEYACRAMAQTRAISRACRAAFAHVVVLMDAGLSTTPAEEVPDGGFDNSAPQHAAPATKTPPVGSQTPKQPIPAGDDLPFESAAPAPINPTQVGELPETIGSIDALSTKTGTNSKGPWTKTSIKVNGEWYQTFSDTIATGAANAKQDGKSVRIIYKEVQSGQYTNRNIEFLTVLD